MNVLQISIINNTLDKTYKEIRDAFMAGKACILYDENVNPPAYKLVKFVGSLSGGNNGGYIHFDDVYV